MTVLHDQPARLTPQHLALAFDLAPVHSLSPWSEEMLSLTVTSET